MKKVSEIINCAAKYVKASRVKVALTGGLIANNPQFLELIVRNLDSTVEFDIAVIKEAPIYGALKLAMELE